MYVESQKQFAEKETNCYGTRSFYTNGNAGPYVYHTYRQLFNLVVLMEKAFQKIQHEKNIELRIGIMSSNRYEWNVVDIACSCLGIVTVPIYDSYSQEQVKYAVQKAEVNLVFGDCKSLSKMNLIKDKVIDIVCFDDLLVDRAMIQKQRKIQNWVLPITQKVPEIKDLLKLEQNENGFYKLELPEIIMQQILDKQKRQYDISNATKFFSQLIMEGYEVMFPLSQNSDSQKNQIQDSTNLPLIREASITPDSPMTFIYTSGTTGDPKASVILQKNILYTARTMKYRYLTPDMTNPEQQERLISYLPMAHVFWRCINLIVFMAGGVQGVWQGDSAKLLDDIREFKITVFICVPRILQKIYAGIKKQISLKPLVVQKIFNMALNSRLKVIEKERKKLNDLYLESYKQGKQLQSPSQQHFNRFKFPKWTNAIFNQFQNILGRCRFMISGSAPLDSTQSDFLVALFNLSLMEGFGMTETCSTGCVQIYETLNFGHIGIILDKETELRLKSLPELNYTVQDKQILEVNGQQFNVTVPRGELQIKSPSVFKEYYHDEEKTKAAFEGEWFCTGDVATFNPITYEITIIDRAKSCIKLSQGEYISINQIEDALYVDGVENVYLYANRYFSGVCCVVQTHKEITKANLVALLIAIQKSCKAKQLKSYEIPKAVIIDNEEWTPENGLLTPSMKVQRGHCQTKFSSICTYVLEKVLAEGVKFTPEQVADIVLDGYKHAQDTPGKEASVYSGLR